ncbi:hypothetical protein GA0116948_107200 [Chitinophaga costaii]|uniref:Uncharacterized protein n=1 Tax=Chitinophaga costaii TaxID=1335309 RepID=A0A1C4E9V7_9BACT|nr:hypothetical protein GA0116948_107200 [Chitinophaga costaii]
MEDVIKIMNDKTFDQTYDELDGGWKIILY